jgi:hypothetical protein
MEIDSKVIRDNMDKLLKDHKYGETGHVFMPMDELLFTLKEVERTTKEKYENKNN